MLKYNNNNNQVYCILQHLHKHRVCTKGLVNTYVKLDKQLNTDTKLQK